MKSSRIILCNGSVRSTDMNAVAVTGSSFEFWSISHCKASICHLMRWHSGRGLEFIDRCYTGNGWYKDGENGQSDYYVPFGMQFYGILYAMKMQEIDPQGCRKFIKRAEAFGKEFVYWFDEDGSALPYGRSQTYRFAQSAFYSLCIAAGIEPLPLGVMKGILVRNLEFWMKQPVFDRAGLLTIGYAYPNLTMAESL